MPLSTPPEVTSNQLAAKLAAQTRATDYAWAQTNAAYTTFSGAGVAGFTATYTGAVLAGAWSAEFPMVAGVAIRVPYSLVQTSGQAPTLAISRTGSASLASTTPYVVSNTVALAAAGGVATLTPTESGLGRLYVSNTAAASFAVSGLSVARSAPAYDQDAQGYSLAHYIKGREYAGAWCTALATDPGTVPTAELIVGGDSTFTDPETSATSYNSYSQIIARRLKQCFGPNVTVLNRAVGGTYTANWIAGTLTADIARNPQAFLIGHLLNDLASGRAGPITRLEAIIDQIRASRTIAQTSIFVTGCISANDTASGRDMVSIRLMNAALRDLCARKCCVFIDQFSWMQDSETMKGITWDTTGTAGAPVHNLKGSNYPRADLALDAIIPGTLGMIQMSPVAGTPTNSWSNFSGSYAGLRYTRNQTGLVTVTGLIKPGTTTDGTALFTLPAGFRPVLLEQFALTTDSGACVLNVSTTGAATINGLPGGTVYVRLNFSFNSL